MSSESATDTDVKTDMGALWRALRRRAFRIIAVTVLLLAATYAVLLFVPKSYEATASILVESRDSIYTRPAGDNSGGSTVNPDDSGAIASQIELVRSRNTLLSVVHSQNLASIPEFNGTGKSALGFITEYFKKPSAAAPEDVAVDALADHLLVARQRDSALINVTVRSTDPQLAATLANAIAQADVARRAGLSLSDTADASQWLQQQITDMRQRVEDAETKVANFKVANDLFFGTNSTSLLDQQLTELSSQMTAAQGRRSTAQSRATLIRGLLAAGQPIDGIDDVRNSVTIQQLMQQKAQLMSQRAQLLVTFLPTHPSVRTVTAQIVAVDRQIEAEGRRVADALDAEAKIEDSLQASLQSDLDKLKGKVAKATTAGVTLDALDREAKADRDLLESYMGRYRDASARTDANSALPDLRVVTLAAAPSTPSSPKTTLILAAVLFVSLAVQIGMVLFGELLSGRALVERTPVPVIPGVWPQPVAAAAPPPVLATAAVGVAPEMATADNAESEEAARRAEANGLRAWFSKRAQMVGTGLTTSEPPRIIAGSATSTAEPQAVEFAAAEAELAANEVAMSEPALVQDDGSTLAALSSDLVLGRTRIVLITALTNSRDGELLADRLIADILHGGLSVARVDAGSGRPSTEPGITDLAAERASFGDVVHRTSDTGHAEIPWGHLTTLDRRSTRPITLVEALADIYETVLVQTGRIGAASSLSLFAGLPCRLVLVSSGSSEPGMIEAGIADGKALGFKQIDVLSAPPQKSQVA